MANKLNKGEKLTKLNAIKLSHRALRDGQLPGQGRARKFKDRKKDANKRACRMKVNHF